jgi:hypothetical protein
VCWTWIRLFSDNAVVYREISGNNDNEALGKDLMATQK